MSEFHGGCACGAVRYRLASEPFDAGYCHCRICQLTSGAPVMAFATVPRDDLQFVQGEPARRVSSSFGERWFCRDCGTPLAMAVTHQPETIDFAIATLDDPDGVAPGFHIWTQSRIAWFETDDRLIRHERFRPDTVGLTDAVAAGAPNGAQGEGRQMNEKKTPETPTATQETESDPSVVADVELPDPKDVNPLAPPISTEAGA
jgi:hypothetical protein